MPIYEYQCDDCEALIEAFQKMSDDPLTKCEQCGGSLRKVLHPVAIHFKGSGFYTTDYGKGSSRRTGGKEPGSGDASSSPGESSSSGDGPAGTANGSSGEGKAKAKEKQQAT